ncbi:MAG: LD-carboxypeptidase [Clostridiales bacterium]|nr:LD-carboxypeptidase [Clostridiales bacterium]
MFTLPLLKEGDTVGIIACSDGIEYGQRAKIEELISVFNAWDLEVDVATTIYRRNSFFSGPPRERADELNRLFADDNIKAIFDVSGGDSANHMLPYIDFEMIKANPKPFFGLSDLSVILNSLYTKSNMNTYHYYIMNLVREYKAEQRKNFYNSIFEGKSDLFDFSYYWIQGEKLEGQVLGGNLRCSLKLVGTEYFPDFRDKVILLESLSGRANRLTSLMTQWSHIGCFDKCAGIILGTFTELEEHYEFPIVKEYILELTKDRKVPIAKTDEIGHNPDSKAIVIGGEVALA